MHELSIAQSIFECVKQELQKAALSAPVKSVKIKAGKMRAIVPDSLKFNFAAVCETEPQLRGTELIIEEVPATAHCQKCNKTFTLADPIFYCSDCGQPIDLLTGEELIIDSVDVTLPGEVPG